MNCLTKNLNRDYINDHPRYDLSSHLKNYPDLLTYVSFALDDRELRDVIFLTDTQKIQRTFGLAKFMKKSQMNISFSKMKRIKGELR